MKMLLGIVFLFGTTLCTTNSLCSPSANLKKCVESTEKGSISNVYKYIANISFISSNNDPTVAPTVVSTKLSKYTTTSSHAVKKQEDQTGGQSEAQSKGKNTVPSGMKDTNSLKDIQTSSTKNVEESTSLYNQTEEKTLKGQELQTAKGTEFPNNEHSASENKPVIKQRENLTSSVREQEHIKNVKFVGEHDLPIETTATPSCSTVWPECSQKHLDNTVAEVAKDLITFTLNLFQKLSEVDSRPNLVISPISVVLTLSHLMLGADGKTKDDMLNTLYKRVTHVHCIHEAMKNFTIHDSFLSASEIFYNKELHMNEEFIDQSSNFYGSKGIPLPKDKKKSLEKINSWISKRTKQLIPTLLQEIPSDLQVLLVNVIHYQGKWFAQFDPSLTRNENFYRLSSMLVKVPMMNAHKYPLQILTDTYLHAQVARFPLSNNSSLLVFLPLAHSVDALKIMENRLSQEILSLLIRQLEEVPVRATSVSFPQLKLDTNYGLNEALSLLGLYDLFEYPNLCALSNSTDIAVSEVHHRALLEIKEEGVKAAASSAITIARTVTVFAARRPFLFILMSDNSRIPVLIGHIKDPSQ